MIRIIEYIQIWAVSYDSQRYSFYDGNMASSVNGETQRFQRTLLFLHTLKWRYRQLTSKLQGDGTVTPLFKIRGFFAMSKSGIWIKYIDLKFCIVPNKIFRYGEKKFPTHVCLSKVSKFQKMWCQINR